MAEEISQKKSGGKIGSILILVGVLLLILFGIFVALLKFDVGSLGTKVIGPKIQNIPGATFILPKMPSETDGETLTDEGYQSFEEVVEILKVTENLLKEKEEEAETLIEQINQLQNENKRLKTFEDRYLEFDKEKSEFDRFIVEQFDSESYPTWYEKMNPDNAAKIYEEMVEEKVDSEQLHQLITTYDSMKPANAAAILSEMSTTRLAMVATIIKNLDAEQAGKILAAMDTSVAARITTYLYPEE
ncbi:hypothetical protein QBE53_07195 [Vallitaleaceae bacterium 9-2]